MNTAARTIDISPVFGSQLKDEIELPEGIEILEGNPSPHHSIFRIMHPNRGDERLTWDRRDFAGIKAAKETFVQLVKKGLTPYRVGVRGERTAEVMAEFDPTAEEVLFLSKKLVKGG